MSLIFLFFSLSSLITFLLMEYLSKVIKMCIFKEAIVYYETIDEGKSSFL